MSTRQPGGLFRGPPAYTARTPWRPVQAVAAVAVILLLGAAVGRLPEVANAIWGGPMVAGEWADVASRVLVLVLTVGASMLLGGRARDVLALRSPAKGWRSYAGAALLSVVVVPLLIGAVLIAVAALSGQLEELIQSGQDDYSSMRAVDVGWPLAVVVAPLEEEVLFRGFLLSALAQTRLRFWGAAVVSVALWTGLHDYSVLGLAKIFGTGLVFSWILWRTGSLRVTIFCHAVNNGLALLLLQLWDMPF
jgi:membrane protease YdiL (CAAX protease family)